MQESIGLLVDVASALAAGTAEGNVFLVNAKVADKSRAAHLDSPVYTRVTGVHDPAGRVVRDVTLNWVVTSLRSQPDRRPTERVLPGRSGSAVNLVLGLAQVSGSLQAAKEILELLNEDSGATAGQPDPAPQPAPELQSLLPELLAGGGVPPILIDVTGPAVEDGIIFPAMYGSPDLGTDGWYWSATVDTHRVGVHRYTLHLALFRPEVRGSVLAWLPEIHTCSALLEVRNVQAVNGFTGGPPGWLPMPCLAPDESRSVGQVVSAAGPVSPLADPDEPADGASQRQMPDPQGAGQQWAVL